jgi:hypothetical protein
VAETSELARARSALDEGKLADALFELRQARTVAVAQGRVGELLEVRGLLASLSARSDGRVKAGSEALAYQVDEDVRAVPADELLAAGVQPEPDPLPAALARWRASAPDLWLVTTPELSRARAALEWERFPEALSELRVAQRVAVAQAKPVELLAVKELVDDLTRRSTGKTRAASEDLARRIEAGFRSMAESGEPGH